MSGTVMKKIERMQFIQFTGSNIQEILEFIPAIREYQITQSLEGVKLIASVFLGPELQCWRGDFLIIKGDEYSVATNDQFRKHYEPALPQYGDDAIDHRNVLQLTSHDLELRRLALDHAVRVHEHHSETIARANAYFSFLKGSAK